MLSLLHGRKALRYLLNIYYKTTKSICYFTGQFENNVINVGVNFLQGFSFPSEAGYALDSKQAKFYMMETHYNNPLNSAESVKSTNRQNADNSGLKLYYTNSLRNHDAGVLSIGKLLDIRMTRFSHIWYG